MKSVSEQYKNSMSEQYRNRSYVRIYFGNADVTAAGDGEWVSNGEIEYSEKDTLDYKYDYGATMATLEWNRWVLDGTQDIYDIEKNTNDGFISDKTSDENGEFTTNAVLTREFSELHDLLGLTLYFDRRTGEYPTSVTINAYRNNVLLQDFTVEPKNTNVVVEMRVEDTNKIEIIFNSTLPYRRPRLEYVFYGIGREYNNSDIVNCKQSHDVDPLTRRLPNEKFDFTILDYQKEYDADNPKGVYEFVGTKAPCSISYGYTLDDNTIEWLKEDNYLLSGKPQVNNNQATFSATGLVNTLTNLYYKSKIGLKNFYDMAIDVLEDADLTLTPAGEVPWDIDESLKDLYTTAVLPIAEHNKCLQLIAHACCCKLYTDDNNIIHIKPLNVSELIDSKEDFNVNFGSVYENTQKFSKIDELKAVTVSKTVYTKSEKPSKLHESTTTETNLHIEFTQIAKDITINVTGGSVVSSTIYGRAIDLVLSSGEKNILIEGNTFSESNIIYTYNFSPTGEIDSEENPLLTDDTMCFNLANHIAAYLLFRNTYDFDYRGNPELETQDVIEFQTEFSERLNGLVLTDEIDFNGSLRGHLKLKSLGAVTDE